jgi:predicted TIM-barrel fold metal-dependent hydrolase
MPTTSLDAPAGVGNTLTFVNAAGSMLDWIFSGKLAHFRNINLSFAEAQAGWLPYVLERADVVFDYNRAWNNAAKELTLPPSEVFRERMYACLFEDAHALRCLDEIGADNVVFETDYPHADSTWPDCKEVAGRLTKELSDLNRWKVLRGNAIRMLKLDLPY